MARNLLCPICDARRKRYAVKFNELYESVKGNSKGEYLCDGCYPAKPIHVGDLCFAAVELPNKEHDNYYIHRPQFWMNDYIIQIENQSLTP